MTKICRKLPKFSYNQYGQKIPKSSRIDHFLSKILSKIDPNDQKSPENCRKWSISAKNWFDEKQAYFDQNPFYYVSDIFYK